MSQADKNQKRMK